MDNFQYGLPSPFWFASLLNFVFSNCSWKGHLQLLRSNTAVDPSAAIHVLDLDVALVQAASNIINAFLCLHD